MTPSATELHRQPSHGQPTGHIQAWGLWLRTAVRVVLGAVWMVAGLLKVPDPAAAERAVRAYQLAPEALVPALAFGLPVLEIAVGMLLIAGMFVRPAAARSGRLLPRFIAPVAAAWVRGLTIDCGCFGGGGQVDEDRTAYLSELLRDAAMLCASIFLAIRPRTRLALLDRVHPMHEGDRDALDV